MKRYVNNYLLYFLIYSRYNLTWGIGYAACIPREKINKEKEPERVNIVYPQHGIMAILAEVACKNKIVVDQFIFMSPTYDLSTMAVISNLSGGHVQYYQPSKDTLTMNSTLKKCIMNLHEF